MSKTKLPNKPSDLIDIALKDLAKVERQPKTYTVSMANWHFPRFNFDQNATTCFVCLAGAVMAKSIGCDPDKHVELSDFGNDTKNKLDALDTFRVGLLYEGLRGMGRKRIPKDLPSGVRITPYSEDPKQFRKDMRRVVKLLRQHNL